MQDAYFFHIIQTKSESLDLVAFLVLNAVKSIEYVRQFFGWNAHSFVGKIEQQIFTVNPCMNPDDRLLITVFYRVVDQILDDIREMEYIQFDFGMLLGFDFNVQIGMTFLKLGC